MRNKKKTFLFLMWFICDLKIKKHMNLQYLKHATISAENSIFPVLCILLL